VSSFAIGQTVEERLAALEKRVTELEAKKGEGELKAASAPQAGVIFSDGFEKGIAGWDCSNSISIVGGNPERFQKNNIQITYQDTPRAAKEI